MEELLALKFDKQELRTERRCPRCHQTGSTTYSLRLPLLFSFLLDAASAKWRRLRVWHSFVVSNRLLDARQRGMQRALESQGFLFLHTAERDAFSSSNWLRNNALTLCAVGKGWVNVNALHSKVTAAVIRKVDTDSLCAQQWVRKQCIEAWLGEMDVASFEVL